MTREWQIKIDDAELAYAGDLGIEEISISYASLAADTATLHADSSFSVDYGAMVGIYYAGTRVFLGRCTRPYLTAETAIRTIRLVGPWEWLERIPFRQAWHIWQDDELGSVLQSRVILNQDDSGDPVTVEAQLAAIVACAAARGAPLAFGSASVSLTLPFDEQRDIRCAAAIARLLRFSPDTTSRIDYTPATPVIYFGSGSALTLPSSAESIVSGWRDDLVVPGLTIEIERISTTSGDDGASSYRYLEYLTAGVTDSVDSLFATLQLAGPDSSRSSLTVDVDTEDIPDPIEDAAWWIARHPRLKGIAAADLSFIQAVRHDGKTGDAITDAEDYPRISLNPIADLDVVEVASRVEQFRATVDIVKRDDAGEIIDAEHGVELALDLITTNATSKEYRVTQSYSSTTGEPTPADLATQLLAHLSVRYAEGSASWPCRDLWPSPGNTLYGTPIQTVAISSGRKLAEVVFGPPQHLSVADFASVLQGFRTHRASVSWQARTDGKPAADNELQANQAAPAKVGAFAPGAKRQMTVTAADGDGGSIQINPTQLDDDETIKVRTISYRDADDNVHTAKILASDHITQDDTDPPEDDPPPCGHPGNYPGGDETDDSTDHPGDEPGGDDSDSSTDHPGDEVSPPSSGDCE